VIPSLADVKGERLGAELGLRKVDEPGAVERRLGLRSWGRAEGGYKKQRADNRTLSAGHLHLPPLGNLNFAF
jgi:hypothetical protein